MKSILRNVLPNCCLFDGVDINNTFYQFLVAAYSKSKWESIKENDAVDEVISQALQAAYVDSEPSVTSNHPVKP